MLEGYNKNMNRVCSVAIWDSSLLSRQNRASYSYYVFLRFITKHHSR